MSFEKALADVTGLRVELRKKAAPHGGWVRLVAPGTAQWWNYYPYGEHIFAVDINHSAVDEWSRAISGLTAAVPGVERGSHGLMRVPALRDAETRLQAYARLLSGTSAAARRIAGPVLQGAEVEGTAAGEIAHRTTGVADRLDGELARIGAASVAGALGTAADALASFGRTVADAFWAASDVLEKAVNDGIGGVSDDLIAYLARHGMASDEGVLYSFPTDNPARDNFRVRNLLAGFYPQGRVPAGMDEVRGDPTRDEFWAAASAAITRRLTVALDDLDDAAAHAQARLTHAYRAATTAMGGTVTSEDTPPAEDTPLADGFSGLTPGVPMGRLSTGLAAGSFGALSPALGSLATPLGAMTPATPAAGRSLEAYRPHEE